MENRANDICSTQKDRKCVEVSKNNIMQIQKYLRNYPWVAATNFKNDQSTYYYDPN